MKTYFYACVQVYDSEQRPYWNPLSPYGRKTRAEAEQDVLDYIEHKKHGTGGFRKGAPARTKVEEVQI